MLWNDVQTLSSNVTEWTVQDTGREMAYNLWNGKSRENVYNMIPFLHIYVIFLGFFPPVFSKISVTNEHRFYNERSWVAKYLSAVRDNWERRDQNYAPDPPQAASFLIYNSQQVSYSLLAAVTNISQAAVA